MNLPDKAALLRRALPARAKWESMARPAAIEPVGPGEESVWDFPRPPAVEDVAAPLRVALGGVTIAETARGKRVTETAGAPVYFFPPADTAVEFLRETGHVTVCEWKGAAIHYALVTGYGIAERAAFAYPDPFDDLGRGYDAIAGWFAFYPSRVSACYLGDEKIRPQPGGYYAGWVAANLRGPIKGAPGSEGW